MENKEMHQTYMQMQQHSLTAEQIEQLLNENASVIRQMQEYLEAGKLVDAKALEARLEHNLRFLVPAAHAQCPDQFPSSLQDCVQCQPAQVPEPLTASASSLLSLQPQTSVNSHQALNSQRSMSHGDHHGLRIQHDGAQQMMPQSLAYRPTLQQWRELYGLLTLQQWEDFYSQLNTSSSSNLELQTLHNEANFGGKIALPQIPDLNSTPTPIEQPPFTPQQWEAFHHCLTQKQWHVLYGNLTPQQWHALYFQPNMRSSGDLQLHIKQNEGNVGGSKESSPEPSDGYLQLLNLSSSSSEGSQDACTGLTVSSKQGLGKTDSAEGQVPSQKAKMQIETKVPKE